MRSWIRSWKLFRTSLLLIVFLLCGTAYSGEEETKTVVEDALERAGGDLILAADLLAEDVVLLVGEVEQLEHDGKIKDNTIIVLEEHLDIVEPGFLKRITDSTLFKVTLFVVGVEVGRRMVVVK